MNHLKSIIQLSQPLSIEEYNKIVHDVIEVKSEQIYESKMHSYIINNQSVQSKIKSDFTLNKKLFNRIIKTPVSTLCLITEGWCLDACIILPLLTAIHLANQNIQIRIFLRDKNDELMNQFLTNGSKSIPIIFALDKKQNEIFRWGPRSTKAKEILEPIKNEEYEMKYKALSEFYMHDKTTDIQEEWIDIF